MQGSWRQAHRGAELEGVRECLELLLGGLKLQGGAVGRGADKAPFAVSGKAVLPQGPQATKLGEAHRHASSEI